MKRGRRGVRLVRCERVSRVRAWWQSVVEGLLCMTRGFGFVMAVAMVLHSAACPSARNVCVCVLGGVLDITSSCLGG